MMKDSTRFAGFARGARIGAVICASMLLAVFATACSSGGSSSSSSMSEEAQQEMARGYEDNKAWQEMPEDATGTQHYIAADEAKTIAASLTNLPVEDFTFADAVFTVTPEGRDLYTVTLVTPDTKYTYVLDANTGNYIADKSEPYTGDVPVTTEYPEELIQQALGNSILDAADE